MSKKTQEKIWELGAVVGAGVDRYKERGNLELEYVDSTVIPKLKEVAGDICRDIEERLKVGSIEDQSKSLVVHYTSIDALFSMLQDAANGQKASLRLYDSVHFNDPEEGYHLVKALSEQHKWIDKGIGHSSHAYIASFVRLSTEERERESDNLMFWRTYGHEGEGCSLKVRVATSRLRNVSYSSRELRSAVRALLPVLRSIQPLVDVGQGEGQWERTEIALAVAFCESLEGIQFLYKNRAYNYEKECRFVMHRSDVCENNICFELKRDSPVTVRHYCEHSDLSVWELFGSDCTITIGPCVRNFHELKGVLRILTRRINQRMNQELDQEMKLLGPSIRESQIKYRRS